MQQRGSNATMETEEVEHSSTTPPSRGRHNSRLKVLGRSEALREETSPPREPSPNHHLQSPCIKLIPSPQVSPECVNPVVVLSPSLNSPCKSPQCLSPTATLVPSPNSRCSPSLCASIDNVAERLQPDHLQETPGSGYGNSSPKYLNKVNNTKNSDASSKQTSHNIRKKYICDCQNPNCIKCIKVQERNINNNLTNVNNNVVSSSPNTLTVSRASSRGKLRQQSSSQGSFESSSNSPCLSRDSSSEQYTDTTGVDLEQFIPETLNRNAKDRALMLRIEQELVNLAKDRCKTHYKFPPMSSYQRMLVHRCAAYFGMDHNIEPTGKSVVVNKTKSTRIPDVEFKEHIKDDIIFSEEPRRSILKRDSNSLEDYSFKSPDRSLSLEKRRSKSIEEREEEYEKVRRRIFNREMHDCSSEDFGWAEIPWSSTDSEYSARFKLQPPSDIHRRHLGKLIKVHSEDTAETLRPYVAKSYSFGGYGGNISVLSRGDSVMSTHSAGPRLLTKQDSAASSVSWRLSPSSSGYKSQSQMSESVTPSPTSTPHPISDSRQNSNGSSENQDHRSEGDNHIVWAVTDIQNVPKGSIIINPQTGKPLKNEDGSIYHYDPNNPPPGMIQTPAKPPPSPHKPSPKETAPASPKKTRSTKTSPTRKSNLTNSSTSPSLPFSPSLMSTSMPQRSFSYVQTDNVVSVPQQHFSAYTSTYATPAGVEGSAVYQQPYIVYTAPYGVQIQQQYERMEPAHVPDMGNTYFIQEGAGPPPAQAITYQHTPPSPYWNQPVAFYQNNPQTANPTPPQRFPSAPIQAHTQPGFVPTGYPPNYLPPPAQPPHNQEMVPVYSNQPVQLVYQNQPTPPNPMVYQNQPPMIYTQNPVYQAPAYPPPQMTPQHLPPQHLPQNLPPYPQGTPTPNSCASSASGPVFAAPGGQDPQGYVHLTQSMQQLALGNPQGHPNFIANKGPQQFDFRQKGNNGLKGNKFCSSKNFIIGSSQSSTGTNSPAATVIAGYCPPQNAPGMYRTPPETPPNQPGFPPNFNVPPMIYRQMNNVRASTPGTARSSRSPTPASEGTHYERQRMSLPPNMYQGMSYVVPTDPRIIPGRGQPAVYRQAAPMNKQNFSNGSENRSHKGRKSKANKQSGLPPNGKQI